jgi:hypothetical protein
MISVNSRERRRATSQRWNRNFAATGLRAESISGRNIEPRLRLVTGEQAAPKGNVTHKP